MSSIQLNLLLDKVRRGDVVALMIDRVFDRKALLLLLLPTKTEKANADDELYQQQ